MFQRFSRLFGGAERQAERDLERRIGLFRADVMALGEAPDLPEIDRVVARQRELGLDDDDVALEIEVVDGFRQVIELTALVAAAGPPLVETTHRVLSDDRCYFVAPASLITASGDQGGKLFLTDRRAIFAGSGVISLAWPTISRIVEDQRDVVFARNGSDGVRCRCNSFVDSKRGVFLSRWLREQNSRRPV